MLKVKKLVGGYTKGHAILQSIELEVKKGEAIGIIGLNGSGKSTFGKALMNLLPYRRGEIQFKGIDITKKQTSQLAKEGISLFMQGGKVFDELSVWENLVLSSKKTTDIEEIRNYFELLTISPKELSRLRADKLSGGQRHQLALAMCMLKKPELLILDEPSAGLSPKAINNMYSTLEKMKREENLTIILIEQNIAKAVEFCDSVNLLQEGRIKCCFENRNLKEIENIMFN